MAFDYNNISDTALCDQSLSTMAEDAIVMRLDEIIDVLKTKYNGTVRLQAYIKKRHLKLMGTYPMAFGMVFREFGDFIFGIFDEINIVCPRMKFDGCELLDWNGNIKCESDVWKFIKTVLLNPKVNVNGLAGKPVYRILLEFNNIQKRLISKESLESAAHTIIDVARSRNLVGDILCIDLDNDVKSYRTTQKVRTL